jgi:hypothetical protein
MFKAIKSFMEGIMSQEEIEPTVASSSTVLHQQIPEIPQELVYGGVAIVTLSLVLLLIHALTNLIEVSKKEG